MLHINKVANYNDKKIDELLNNSEIIRSKNKISSKNENTQSI